MVFANQHPRDVRADQPDKADGADEGHGKRSEQADHDQRLETQAAHVDTEAGRLVIPQPQGGERPGAPGENRQGDQDQGFGEQWNSKRT